MDSEEPIHPALRGLKTVCRCNNIKYRTIERVIRAGACTIAQVAQCTTATTGHCGGSCTPDVQEMLDRLAPKRVTKTTPAASATSGPAGAWWIKK